MFSFFVQSALMSIYNVYLYVTMSLLCYRVLSLTKESGRIQILSSLEGPTLAVSLVSSLYAKLHLPK